MVGIHSFNHVWQANSRGVDINHNFDAKWQMVVDKPSPSKYGGEYAESEPETRAITEFVRKEQFDMLLTLPESLHIHRNLRVQDRRTTVQTMYIQAEL